MKVNKGNKIIFGALSAVAATVAAGAFVKKAIDKKVESKPKKDNKNVYFTVTLEDIYSPYEDKTLSDEDMINEIKRETLL